MSTSARQTCECEPSLHVDDNHNGGDNHNDHDNHNNNDLDSDEQAIVFSALVRGLTTKQDIRTIINLCRRILDDDNHHLYKALLSIFFHELVTARFQLPQHVLAMERSVSPEWYKNPWYIAYVQYTGVNDGTSGNFDTLRRMIPYIRHDLGFRNICLLPHYESPMGDNGFDISSYTVRAKLGGEPAFNRFMDDARANDLHVATEAVFNHTSTEHDWFQRAISGDEQFQRYYLQRNGREKIAEWERNADQSERDGNPYTSGEIVCKYRDINGCLTERGLTFPQVDRTHGLWVEIDGRTHQFYRSFYPFQVDLNLRNVDVLRELMRTLAADIRSGVLAKRMSAVSYWVKKPGMSDSEDSDQTHAILALLKSFLRHLHRRAVVLSSPIPTSSPSSSSSSSSTRNIATYAGRSTTIRRLPCASEGDGIVALDMQSALFESVCLQTVAPFWRRLLAMNGVYDEKHKGLANGHSVWLNSLEDHDGYNLAFHPRPIRNWLAYYISSHCGSVYNNGRLAAVRLSDALGGNASRLVAAITLCYITPGTPMIYCGTELGMTSQWEYAQTCVSLRLAIFNKLGVYVDESAAFDPRDLHRGEIPRERFENAVETQSHGVVAIKRLNYLCKILPNWTCAPLVPVQCNDVAVLAAIKKLKADRNILCLINLSPLSKSLSLPADQVEHVLGLDVWARPNDVEIEQTRTFRNLIDGGDVNVRFEVAFVNLSLDAFGCVFICDWEKQLCNGSDKDTPRQNNQCI